MANTETDFDPPEHDFTDFDLCDVADQLERARAYIGHYDPLGDDLIVPASILSDVLAWMLRAYDDPDHNIGQAEILANMAHSFAFIFGAEYGDLPPDVETAKDKAIEALDALVAAVDRRKMN